MKRNDRLQLCADAAKVEARQDLLDLMNRFDGLFAKVLEIIFPDGMYHPPTPCDEIANQKLRPTQQSVVGGYVVLGAIPPRRRRRSVPARPHRSAGRRAIRRTASRRRCHLAIASRSRRRRSIASCSLSPSIRRTRFALLRRRARLRARRRNSLPAAAGTAAARTLPWTLSVVAGRVPGVGPMPYERYGALLPGWNGTTKPTSPTDAARSRAGRQRCGRPNCREGSSQDRGPRPAAAIRPAVRSRRASTAPRRNPRPPRCRSRPIRSATSRHCRRMARRCAWSARRSRSRPSCSRSRSNRFCKQQVPQQAYAPALARACRPAAGRSTRAVGLWRAADRQAHRDRGAPALTAAPAAAGSCRRRRTLAQRAMQFFNEKTTPQLRSLDPAPSSRRRDDGTGWMICPRLSLLHLHRPEERGKRLATLGASSSGQPLRAGKMQVDPCPSAASGAWRLLAVEQPPELLSRAADYTPETLPCRAPTRR